jgi:hypothetical protein
MSETAYGTLVIDVIESKEGVDYIVGSYTASIGSNVMDVTGKHDERLKKVLQDCLTNYTKTNDANKTALVFDVNQSVKSKIITDVPLKGIYLTYADVLNEKPLDDTDFEITNKNEKFYLLNKATHSEEIDYYGLAMEEIFSLMFQYMQVQNIMTRRKLLVVSITLKM